MTKHSAESSSTMYLPVLILVVCTMALVGLVFFAFTTVDSSYADSVETVSEAAADSNAEQLSGGDSVPLVLSQDDIHELTGETDRAIDPASISAAIDSGWVSEVSQLTGMPQRALAAYAGADRYMRNEQQCQVGWNTLAAIGQIESHHGTIGGGSIPADGVAVPEIIGVPLDGDSTALIRDTDGGRLDGDTEYDRAVGPMQFIPDTWKRWGTDGSGDGVADPHNIDDAALSAARYLCYSRQTLDDPNAWVAAIRSYNDSAQYQNDVARVANEYVSKAQ